MDDLVSTFAAEFPKLKEVWMSALLLGVACLVAGWGIGRFMGSEKIGNLQSRLDRRDDDIADYKNQLAGKTPDEAAARIARLEATIAHMSPLALSDEQIDAMTRVLGKTRSAVRINRDVSSANVDHAYRQMISLFGKSGWLVEDGVVLGSKENASCGVRLILRPDMDEAAVTAIRSALETAQITFDEVNQPDRREGVTVPQILLTSPWEAARWS